MSEPGTYASGEAQTSNPTLRPESIINQLETKAKELSEKFAPIKSGAATYIYDVKGESFDVVKDYTWTLSKKTDEVPVVKLVEFEVDESTIVNQISYYASGLGNQLKGNEDPMSPYENLFPQKSTGNNFRFPYFSDVNFEVSTPVWQTLDAVEQGFNAIGLGDAFKGIEGIYKTGLAAVYPRVGIMDRPRVWQNHEFRTINIKFPLFNTINPDDWEKNRFLCWVLVNNNLFTKRDFITSIPPVYYQVIIPGQHFSYASCVTNLTINNRGNMRTLKDRSGNDCIVPDAYEVNMTLTDMVMPSRNLFQHLSKVQVG
jgi:hypothetical protein